MGKIVTLPELVQRAQAARQAGQTIVHGHGCFDIVHPGHIRYLEFARQKGDLLVVSLTGDALIEKGDQRPYIPQELRAENLAALAAVDLVYINPHPTAEQLLSALRPDVYVKGSEYELSRDPGFLREQEIVRGYGGRVIFSSGDVVFSSSRLIELLGRDSGLEVQRLSAICSRHQIDAASLGALLARFRDLRVLVIGDIIMDRYVFCDALDVASEAPMMSLSRLSEQTCAGGAAIVARHAAGLGARTYLLSTTSSDPAAQMVQETLAAAQIATKLIPCRPRLPEKTRYLVDTTKVLRVEDAQNQPLDSASEEQAVAWVAAMCAELDAVIFCDFGYGTITASLLERLHRTWGRRKPFVAADVSGPRGRLRQFKYADLLCPTERELRLALHDFESGLSSIAWRAMDATRAAHLLVTLGKKGVVTFDRPTQDTQSPLWRGRLRSEYLPSLADVVVDPLGCGDALLAASALSLAGGGSLMQAAYLGSAAAALEIARLGNLPIDAPALQRWLGGRLEISTVDRGAEPGEALAEGRLYAPATR